MVHTVGAPVLLFWCLGAPALFCAALRRERERLAHPATFASLGFLYGGYAPRRYCWEAAVIARKFAVVAAASLINSRSTAFMRLIACLGIALLALLAQVRAAL